MSENQRVVEVSVSYETVVDEIGDAWSFIMSKIEKVGPNPSVHIHPATNAPPPLLQVLVQGHVDADMTRKFHVRVEGTQQESEDKPMTFIQPSSVED